MKVLSTTVLLSAAEQTVLKAASKPNNRLHSLEGQIELSDKTPFKLKTIQYTISSLKKAGFIRKNGTTSYVVSNKISEPADNDKFQVIANKLIR